MSNRIINKLTQLATGKNIIILLVLFLLFNFLIIPAVYPQFQTLDMLFSYTPEKAYELISSYGEQGRQYYAVIELTLDLIYTFQRALPNHRELLNLSYIPFAVMLADYLENVGIVISLLAYPQKLPLIVCLANFFTISKYILTPFELLVAVGLIGWLIRVIRSRRSI
jgi:hypothetical protein